MSRGRPGSAIFDYGGEYPPVAKVDLGPWHSMQPCWLAVNLNGSTSYPVADALAARGIPFIFATGYNGHGMKGYSDRPLVTKPFRLDDLIEVFTRLFSERSSVLFDEALPPWYAHGQQVKILIDW